MQTIRKTFCLIVAAAVLASSFAASVHVHVHHDSVADKVDSVSAPCSCGFVHQVDSENDASPSFPADTPCDHSDCQLCKFISEFGLVEVSVVELDAQGMVEIHQEIWCANYLSDVSDVYQGRAPPTV